MQVIKKEDITSDKKEENVSSEGTSQAETVPETGQEIRRETGQQTERETGRETGQQSGTCAENSPPQESAPTEEGTSVEGKTEEKEEDAEDEETRPSGDDLAARLAETKNELNGWKDKFMRMAAEYDNYRKRTQKERESLYSGAVADTAEKFLPIYDNLERALGQQTEDAAFYKGVELIQTGLLGIFDKLHIHPIDALGKPFDPALHNAVMHIQDESDERNTVAEVFQTGFTLNDQVIRYAMVKVKN